MDVQIREQMRQEVLGRISRQRAMSDEEVFREIDRAVLRRNREHYDSLGSLGDLRQETFDAIRRFGLLEKYLRDSRVTEIMTIGHRKIFIERDGVILRTEDSFPDEDALQRLIGQIVAPTNRIVNESRPIADSRLPDGSRVHIILPPISLEGPVITIRKFQKGGMTIDKLIRSCEFPEKLAPVLKCLVRGKYSILISGATNSGKSSLLNALGQYIGKRERIITIEDSAELQLFHLENLVRLETRDVNAEGRNEVSMQDLIRSSLRMRPDRIIVGEVRGREAMSMIHAFSTGHNGSLSSIHANSCRDGLRRLETMVLMGMDMPLTAIQGMISSSIDILIHLSRRADGERKITGIIEMTGFRNGDYMLNPLFLTDCMEDGASALRAVKDLYQQNKLIEEGIKKDYEEAMEAYRNWENDTCCLCCRRSSDSDNSGPLL